MKLAWRTLSVLVCLLFVTRQTLANDVAAAEALFREGRNLMDAGEVQAACTKFADSQRLDPSSGTLINLASCHAELGMTATAWAEFLAAERLSFAQQHPERAAEARRRAAQLEALVSYLTIHVQHPTPGLLVRRNEVPVFDSTFELRLPVDPGSHTIHASAPGHEDWSVVVNIGRTADHQVVDIPALVPVPAAAPLVDSPKSGLSAQTPHPAPVPVWNDHAPSTPPEGSERASLGPAFWAAAGTAAAASGVAAAFGILSLKTYQEAEERCPDRIDCDARTIELADNANTQATVANVALGTAVIAAGLATWFYLSADDPNPSDARHWDANGLRF